MALARRLPAQVGAMGMAAAMAAWHLPSVYDAIWRSDAAYGAMQAALLLPAWAFWSAVLTGRQSQPLGHSFLTLGLAGVMGFLGAILTCAPRVLYLQHVDGGRFGPGRDRRLASGGADPVVPGILPMAALAGWVLQRGWRQGFAA